MEDFSYKITDHAEVERTELADGGIVKRKEMTFRRRLSERACKSPYAATMETCDVVNDKEKTETRSPKIVVDESNCVNQRVKPRNVNKEMLKTGSYVYICDGVQWAF